MIKVAKRLASDMLNLLFPEICSGCGVYLYHGEKEICIKCLYDLPYTDFHLHQENRVAKQLWGRLNLNAAMAMLYFKKGTKVQNLIHHLKYKGRTAIGIKLGNLLAEKLQQNEVYANIDLIIPVPLHLSKQRTRGYNQSKYIADGIAQVLGIRVEENNLIREKVTESQTKKSRYHRYENMQTVFNVANKKVLEGKHVLLVDDVITTGATLEACGNALLNSKVDKLSIASIAFAE